MVRLFKNILLTLSVALPLGVMAQGTTQWRDIHKVKRHETIFGIAHSYDLTIDEILDANPEMRQKGYELKKGDQIFIPYSKSSKASKTTSTVSSVKSAKLSDNKITIATSVPQGQKDSSGGYYASVPGP